MKLSGISLVIASAAGVLLAAAEDAASSNTRALEWGWHGGEKFCTEEMKRCDDGTLVGRDPENDCNFKACPTVELPPFCTEEMKRCDDGTLVGRDPENDCNFKACPTVELRPLEPPVVVCPQVECAEATKNCRVREVKKLDEETGCPKFPCGKVKRCKCPVENHAEWSDAQQKWCCNKNGVRCQWLQCESRNRKRCEGPTKGHRVRCSWNRSKKRCITSVTDVILPQQGRPFRSLEGNALLANAQETNSDAWNVQSLEL